MPSLLRPVLLGAAVLCAAPALATEEISYRWQTPRVTVTWSEGNSTPFDPALRRQVGHWKRVAQALWLEKPAAPPLDFRVSFYGPELGSSGPVVRLKSGSQTAVIPAPLTEERVAQALYRVRDGATAQATSSLPPDDADPRLSSSGEWIASVSWRGKGAELWLVPPVPRRMLHIPFPGTGPVAERAIQSPPRWSPQGRTVAWIQGGRLAFFEAKSQKAWFATPVGRRVVDFQWAPYATLALAKFDDDTFELLDLRRSKAYPMSDLLQNARPTGEFFWSPSGRRLLFRTQSQVVVESLATPRAAMNALERLLSRLVEEHEPPKSESGPNEERLAVLDLAEQRLDAYPVAGTPLEGLPLTGVLWSGKEDLVYAVTGAGHGARQHVVRFPLRREPNATLALETNEVVQALTRRDGTSGSEYLFLRGDQLIPVTDGEAPKAGEPLPAGAAKLRRFKSGPAGGYAGLEGEEITEEESGARLVLEALPPGVPASSAEFSGGRYARGELDSRVLKDVAEKMADAVDFDLYPALGKEVAVFARSPEGSVSSLTTLTSDDGAAVTVDDVSQRIGDPKTELIEIPLVEDVFKIGDARTGLELLAQRYQTLSGRRVALGALGLMAIAAAVYLSYLRKVRRRRPKP